MKQLGATAAWSRALQRTTAPMAHVPGALRLDGRIGRTKNRPMRRRTTPTDAEHVLDAADVDALVVDKRAQWRATSARARRRQRRYQHTLTAQLLRRGGAEREPDDGVEQE